MTPSANVSREAAATAPITMSTYRKAAWENTVPRRTIVSSRHTQTMVTWMVTMPSSTMTTTGMRTAARAPSSRSMASSGTITAWTNSEPASTIASTMRSARRVRFPIGSSFDRATM